MPNRYIDEIEFHYNNGDRMEIVAIPEKALETDIDYPKVDHISVRVMEGWDDVYHIFTDGDTSKWDKSEHIAYVMHTLSEFEDYVKEVLKETEESKTSNYGVHVNIEYYVTVNAMNDSHAHHKVKSYFADEFPVPKELISPGEHIVDVEEVQFNIDDRIEKEDNNV